MADKIVTLDMSFIEKGDVSGKVVNFFSTYEGAANFTTAALATVKSVNKLTGAIGSAISQTVKTAGPTVDVNGKLVVALDDGSGAATYYLNSVAGRFGGVMKIIVTNEADVIS